MNTYMNRSIEISKHAAERMVERSVSTAQVMAAVTKGRYERTKGAFKSVYNGVAVVYAMSATAITVVTTYAV